MKKWSGIYRDIQPPQKDAGAPLVKTRSFWNISSIWHSIHFIEISIINAYVIYDKTHNLAIKKPLSHLEFRKAIVRGLLSGLRKDLGATESKDKSRKRKAEASLNIQHQTGCQLELIPPHPYRVTNRYRCQKHKWENEGTKLSVPQTSYWCKTCKIALCKEVCFCKHVEEKFST